MHHCPFAPIIGYLAAAVATVLAADTGVDLKGKVVAAGGNGIGGARVLLLAAGSSDTTDASGAFRIVADQTPLIRPDGGIHAPSADRDIEVFDVAGRLSGLYGRTPLYADGANGGKAGNSGVGPRGPALAKTSAVVDTLFITRAGFRGRKVPVPDYRMDLDTISLQPETAAFEIRKPAERTLTCGATTSKVLDMDLLCESANDSLHADIYVQSRPTSCVGFTGIGYTAERGWIRTTNGIQPLPQATYEGGGNNKNDRVSFSWNGKFYSFYHSTFGTGGRSCAPPDCMQTCQDKDCRTVLYDGCKRTTCAAPALRTQCVAVKPDGSVPERLDPWKQPAARPLLPCGGDALCK